MKAIFHIHTHFSKDASLTIERLFSFCLKNQIQVVAITDHNTLAGALKAQEIAESRKIPVAVIAGEEIATESGEITGLFLTQEIPKGLSLKETIQEIRKQGGIVYLPHPFDSLRRERIRDKGLIDSIITEVDIIEGFNSRNLKKKDNQTAVLLAEKTQKPILSGCDAHFFHELSHAVMEIPILSMKPENFCKEILTARPLVEKRSFRGFFLSVMKKYLIFFRFILIF